MAAAKGSVFHRLVPPTAVAGLVSACACRMTRGPGPRQSVAIRLARSRLPHGGSGRRRGHIGALCDLSWCPEV